MRELDVIVEFCFLVRIEVELEPFQYQDEVVGQFFETDSFQRGHLLLALLAEVRIVALQHLAFYEALQALL